MILAGMFKLDEEALICDLAETYQIYEYKQLPLSKVAVFSCGLRDDSRIKMKINEQNITLDNFLLADLRDKLSLILWSKTKDAEKDINRPPSILKMLLGKDSKEKKELVFNSGEEFEKERQRLLYGGDA